MKKILIPISTILLSGFVNAQLSTTENYVQSRTYLQPVTTSSSTAKQIETVQYFDGLGRPKQVINVKASPQGKDLVTTIPYDGLGRQVDAWLPTPMNTQNGGIQSGVEASAQGYYGDSFSFAHKNLENSPLERILSQIHPGTDWQGHPVTYQYNASENNDLVRKLGTTTSWVNNATSTVVTYSSDYGATLYKNTVIDEDGNKTIEFKNGQGQLIMVRKVLSPTQNADTYYVYNEYNQLSFVIPPKAVFAFFDEYGAGIDDEFTVDILDNLCYQYRYDGRNRLVEKKLPGKGWDYIVYDKADRAFLTQDANMRPSGNWLLTRYDKLSRVVYTAIAGIGSTYIRKDVQDAVDFHSVTASSLTEERTSAVGFTKSGMDIYYGNNTFPTNAILQVLSVNYYDSYLPGDPFPTMVYDQVVLPSNVQQYGVSTKGLPVSSFVKNIEDDNWTKKYMYYDLKGRLIREYSPNHLGGYTNIEKQLDFSGVPIIILTQQKRLGTDNERVITETFEYDSQNRLLVRKHKVDNNPVEILAQNTYNELSQLSNKKVGGTVASSPLQSIDYTYNIRGWMTQINDPSNLGSDLFGYKINYNLIEGQETPNTDFPDLKVKPKYNGNIAEVSWKTLTEENEPLKRYGYVYDRLNRLNAGFYQKDTNPTAKEYFEKMEYDLNGNITNLKRSQGLASGSTTAMMIDNLNYNYTGNKLTKITELQTGNSNGYPYVPNSTPITYDNDSTEGNGNMTSHPDKGISSIQYNYLNLPKQITQDGKATFYTYRADGVKVKKLFGNVETDYLNGFQYKDTYQIESWNGQGYFNQDPNEVPVMKLRIIPTTEGYYDALLNQYIYNFTDHLGNIRLSYTDTNKDGIVQPRGYFGSTICNGPFFCFQEWKPGEIVEMNNYYPFGLLHDYTATSRNAYQYKYNGKELQETGMYDYGARFYMPDIGRWGVIDPLSQYTHEAYSYVWNNPVSFWDPTGMEGEDPDPKKIYGPKEGALIPEVIVTGSKVMNTNMAGLSFTHQAFIPALPALYAFGEALFYAVATYAAWDIADKTTEALRNRDVSEQEIQKETNSSNLDIFPDKEEIDINGVHIPVDDSGYKKPNNFLAFSKVARGNQRDTGLIGWSDEDISTELAGLKGNLSKEQKALKQRLTKEQKARTTRNKQKKSGEKGTGTGRR